MTPTPSKSPFAEVLTLKWGETYYAACILDRYHEMFLNNLISIDEVRSTADFENIRHAMITMLEAQAQSYTYRTPTTWWEMFKRDHFPPWALKKWPVREHVATVIIKDLFPFPHEKYPGELGDHVRIARIERIPFFHNKED